ncbi:hypothetical protein MUN82_08760 [Hymenobacter aerilatus]|uniref:Uncharacterized protein n=1 Tax=Hymenobacter aerilatus TaxID=2932251 RepID=A0A8T9T2I9_9BACT|nr:hypothetical protein [Hymenobacter aerilatus]UOR07173.1 hypothetical protein MUN82_08760 [Hymenobacter aerilatus]
MKSTTQERITSILVSASGGAIIGNAFGKDGYIVGAFAGLLIGMYAEKEWLASKFN